MARPDRRSSTGIDRRDSMRIPMRHDDDDEDEDFALAAMGISDGLRAADVAVNHNRMPFQSSQNNERPLGRPTPPPRPSSTTKPKFDSFALRHDGAMGPIASRNPAIASSTAMGPTRSSSVSTDMAYVRTESPYQGPVGPSHPYQMYPQESRLARTTSVATTSTVQVQERTYTGPSGPTHPYGMYPQNTVPEAEGSSSQTTTPPVPVGFPGLNNNYQRRLGPDGEEIADIIGPDGHTEQLPPYTQYDEAMARKTRPMVQMPVAGAGGIGLATRNPEFASREDLNSPQSRQSTRSLMSESTHQVNIAALGVSEKPEKKWQRAARRKVCGIVPVWAIVLVSAAFILFIIILASVLVALKPKHPPPHHDDGNAGQSVVVTTMTTTFDAKPFTALPTGISALPTGTFILPITAPSIAPGSCLTNSAQSAAWNCQIAPNLPYQVTVSGIPGGDELSDNEIDLNFSNSTLDFLPYGAQPPTLNQARVLKLVTDSNYPERGPAWFFQIPYNKVVIVPEPALSASSSKRNARRHGEDSTSDFTTKKGVAQPGERPWFCYWNGTLLEAFIYANQTSIAGSKSLSASATATSTYESSVPTSNIQSSSYSSSGPTADPKWPQPYPRVLKLEERRITIGDQSIPPYCVQNFVNPDGTYQPVMNSTNQPVTIYLNETDPATVAPLTGKRMVVGSLEERDGDLNERQSGSTCGCVWLAQ